MKIQTINTGMINRAYQKNNQTMPLTEARGMNMSGTAVNKISNTTNGKVAFGSCWPFGGAWGTDRFGVLYNCIFRKNGMMRTPILDTAITPGFEPHIKCFTNTYPKVLSKCSSTQIKEVFPYLSDMIMWFRNNSGTTVREVGIPKVDFWYGNRDLTKEKASDMIGNAIRKLSNNSESILQEIENLQLLMPYKRRGYDVEQLADFLTHLNFDERNRLPAISVYSNMLSIAGKELTTEETIQLAKRPTSDFLEKCQAWEIENSHDAWGRVIKIAGDGSIPDYDWYHTTDINKFWGYAGGPIAPLIHH